MDTPPTDDEPVPAPGLGVLAEFAAALYDEQGRIRNPRLARTTCRIFRESLDDGSLDDAQRPVIEAFLRDLEHELANNLAPGVE